MPSVRHSLLVAHFLRICPENLHLIGRIVLVPETVPEYLARSGFGLNELQYNPGIGFGTERSWHPVDLRALLPGNNVEMSIILIGKDEAYEIVVVVFVIDVEGSFEVDAAKLIRPLT